MTDKYRRQKARRLLPGRCCECGAQPRVTGKARCRKCIARQRRYRKKVVKRGGCIGCSAMATPGRQRCAACSAVAKMHNATREARRVAAGVCVRCGQAPAREGRRRCEPCLLKDARRKAPARSLGMRPVPPKPPPPVEAEFKIEGEEVLGVTPEEERMDRLRWEWRRSA